MIVPVSNYMTIREVADYLGVSERTVRTWVKAGDLPVIRLGPSGKLVRIAADDLNAYVTERRRKEGE